MKTSRIQAGILFLLFEIFFFAGCVNHNTENFMETGREPAIEPDYSGVTIPPNIAPMNFMIKENGGSFQVKATSSNGTQFTVKSPDGIICFPLRSWKKLFKGIQGGKISLEIFSDDGAGKLSKFNPVNVNVANEPIDPYLCYRMLYPGFELWSRIKIVQRCIENFRESSLIENQLIKNNCINCHSFNKNNPEKFLFHIRGSLGGTLIVDGGKITKKDLKTKEMTSGAVYPSWHPAGRYIAFSSNNIIQSFNALPGKYIEVVDLAAALLLYDTKKNEMIPFLVNDTAKYMETFPEWSPDGKYIYYCMAKKFITNTDLKNIRYDLVRNPFDQTSGAFGETEVVFDAVAINKSVSFPRISPDGKSLVFTLHDYGTFSIFHREADLYLMNLQDGKVSKMSLNSDETESYHSWSSNGKWLVFSSKRGDGLTARPYFAYFGSPDNIGKPFVLPQEDPGLYKRMILTFNKPEFVTGKINFSPRDFARAAREKATKAIWGGGKK